MNQFAIQAILMLTAYLVPILIIAIWGMLAIAAAMMISAGWLIIKIMKNLRQF